MLVRLSIFFRRPISELRNQLPTWELVFWSRYFSREPPPEERIEQQLASLHASFANSKSKGARRKVSDFLPYKDAFAFAPDSGDEEVDSDIKKLMAAFAGRLVIHRRGE